MTFDKLQKTWQSQQPACEFSVTLDLLVREVKRNKKGFERAVLWRDIREVGVGIPIIIFFLYLGFFNALWPALLLAVLCMFVSIFMITDRIRQKKKRPCLSDSSFDCVRHYLVQVDHQIWLLRNILWWYLLPLGIGVLIFFTHIGISLMSKIPSIGLLIFILACIAGTILLYWGIYWLNQKAVDKELAPRKQELEDILKSLEGNSS